MSADALRASLDALSLVDHHVHGAMTSEIDGAGFAAGFSESPWPSPTGTTHLDSQVGIALRRWCAPVLGLPPHVDADAYLLAAGSSAARR